MKRRAYLLFCFLTIIMAMTACGNKSQKTDGNEEIVPQKGDLKVTLTIDQEHPGSADAEQAEEMLRNRLTEADICPYRIERKDDVITVYARLDNAEDQHRLLQLLTASTDIEFWETYNYDVVAPLLRDLSAAYAPNEQPPFIDRSYNSTHVVAALVHVRDSALVNSMLHSEQARQILPSDLKMLWGVKAFNMGDGGDDYIELFSIRTNNAPAPLSTRHITSAIAGTDNYTHRPVVSLNMDLEGANIFADLTRRNIGRVIAIVMNDRVYTAPIVYDAITGGNCEITGNFSLEDVRALAAILNTGSSATLRILSCERIG